MGKKNEVEIPEGAEVYDISGKTILPGLIDSHCHFLWMGVNLNTKVLNELIVSSITLDDFIESFVHECPTFVRMDVEGYEYEIIKGASVILGDKKPLKICMELHPHLMRIENWEELITILKQSNLKVKAIFLEVVAHNYRNINLMNRLRRIMGLSESKSNLDITSLISSFPSSTFFSCKGSILGATRYTGCGSG